MDLLKLEIPLSFIEAQLGEATWRDIQFGLEQDLVSPEAARDLALKQLEHADPSPALLDLATSDGSAVILPLVHQLAQTEPGDDDVKDRWLFLALAWLFERRNELEDPLEAIEIAYADFDYPEKIAGFVRYMPSEEPDLGDPAKNRDRLLGRWERFLHDERQRLVSSA